MPQNETTLSFGPSYREVAVGDIYIITDTLKLECGAEIRDFPMAARTYGKLNSSRNNAILVCHGLTGDQYAAEMHPVTGKPGWWEKMIGSGLPLDTDKYFIIVPNVLGGCMGSLGPKSINPANGKPYGLDFPVITIRDMVAAQKLLIEMLGIEKLLTVIGGSMGGMLTLEWAAGHPNSIHSAIPISTAPRHTAQNIAFHEIGRQAILADPDWNDGNYFSEKKFPSKGLAVARMTAHVTYLSEAGLQRKFGRNLQNRTHVTYGFDADFQIESYLRHQGISFVERFDPNSYLYITRAMDYFDLAADYGGELRNVFKGENISYCVIAFTSDWLFPTSEIKTVVSALTASANDVSFVEIPSDKGHDAFLLDEPVLYTTIAAFIKKVSTRVLV